MRGGFPITFKTELVDTNIILPRSPIKLIPSLLAVGVLITEGVWSAEKYNQWIKERKEIGQIESNTEVNNANAAKIWAETPEILLRLERARSSNRNFTHWQNTQVTLQQFR